MVSNGVNQAANRRAEIDAPDGLCSPRHLCDMATFPGQVLAELYQTLFRKLPGRTPTETPPNGSRLTRPGYCQKGSPVLCVGETNRADQARKVFVLQAYAA